MAENVRSAGALRDRIYLQRRDPGDDGFGNTLPEAGEFETALEVWANLRPLRGSETVIASRLAGRQPYIVTVRSSSETRQVNEAWRIVVKARPELVMAIAAPPSEPERGWIEIVAVLGAPS